MKTFYLIGDFNADSHMESFRAIYHLKSLIQQAICYEDLDKTNCRDLILTNSPRQFQAIANLFSYEKVTLFLHKNTH